ncbi:PLP-dependent aminotransferase family protein [Micromonospora sp. CA-240977]|uniref:aminotransferase-like domain-containing protein n=1 Tax=Micromonospora sp. CA-240977 TaxID=3239957 RepID=UPI003D925E12
MTSGPHVLPTGSLHASVVDPLLDTMTFLNEITSRYPEAVSFGPGRPFDEHFDVADISGWIDTYVRHLRDGGRSEDEVRRALFQYGDTAGQIRPLIADMLRVDEDISVGPEAIVVTTGCQEALLVTLRALFAGPGDVLLVENPCYVGVTGAARLLDIPVVPVARTADGIDPAVLERTVRELAATGRRARALYVVPDCANPSGESLPTAARQALLAAAERLDLLLLEDNPYGLFADEQLPTLKALDRGGRVVYLGSFAKSAFPGARVGYVVADQRVRGAGREGLLADELSRIKSMVSVNTSSLGQAAVAGMLLTHGGGLREANATAAKRYQENMRVLRRALEREFPSADRERLGVAWNTPGSGFFLTVTVPFAADEAVLARSAREYDVIWTPMRYFYLDDRGDRMIRLACSYLTPERIELGIGRLARFIRDAAR